VRAAAIKKAPQEISRGATARQQLRHK
jgi:hypothetical protein